MSRNNKEVRTTTVRAGVDSDPAYGAVMPPLYLTSTFSFAGYEKPRAHDYSRSGNPTRDRLAQALQELEGGENACVTATGMAAVATVLQLVQPGQRVLACHDCYGGSYRLLDAWARKGHFELEFVDFGDRAARRAALDRGAHMVWLESPSNPLLRIVDLEEIAREAHQVGARVVVDNTFLSPVFQNPISLGADIVVHSTTKYINGHSDVLGGALVAANAEIGKELEWWTNCLGVSAGSFDCWLTLRGVRSLHARLSHHEENARRVAAYLESHPSVENVWYPGLPSHPGHWLARRQQSGYGAVLSFELVGGESAVRSFLPQLGCITLAESLGGVESLIAHPATMTHAAMDPEARHRAGIGDGLLRLSVGIEAADDLIGELDAALEPLHPGAPVKEAHS